MRVLWLLAIPAWLAAALLWWAAVSPMDNNPVRAVDLPLFFLMPLLVTGPFLILGKLIQWWLVMPATRRWSSQIRFSPKGWGKRWRLGPVKWREWWPTTDVAFSRVGGGIVSIVLRDRKVPRNNSQPAQATGFSLPAHSSPDRVVSKIRNWQRCITQVDPNLNIDEITHCPECGYLLAVSREIERPGRCPECGWAFDEQTIVLFGASGATFDRQLARGGSFWRRWIIDKLKLLAAGLLFGVLLLALMITVNAGPALSPTVAWIINALFVGGMIALVVWSLARSIKATQDERERKRLFAEGQLRPAGTTQLRLHPDGFAQYGLLLPGIDLFPVLDLQPWSDWRWRVTRGLGYARIYLDRSPRSFFQRVVRRYRPSHLTYLSRLLIRRPVDFVFRTDRETARQLRHRLRQWPAARQLPRIIRTRSAFTHPRSRPTSTAASQEPAAS